MKRIPLICTSTLLALALASCGGTNTAGQAEYIGLDAAKAVALEDAGIQEASAVFSTTGLDKRNGIDFYDVEFTANGQAYEYDIDAVTGLVIESSTNTQTEQVALEATSSPSPSPVVTPAPQTTSTPAPVVQQTVQQTVQTPAPAQSQTTGTAVTAEQAKEKALAHAGLTSSQVTFVQCRLDWENGRQVYEVEFYTADYKEYDYEIDASTGAVVKYDYDAEYSIPQQSSSSQSVTADQAKEKVLAQVPGATVNDIYQFKTDYDDGRIQYEGTIIYNGMKYEFEVDGYSGSIREWESELFGR